MNVRVAIGDDLLTSLMDLPKAVQKKVKAFIQVFRASPKRTGINYEKFNSVDPNLRSVRIDQDYRGIVLAPESGDVYVLLWVAHHDEAYAWGKTRRVEVNPTTGSLQVYDTQIVEGMQREETVEAATTEGALFSSFKNKELMSLGVPEALIPLLRPLESDEDLDPLLEHFPAEAREALTMLAAGYTVEEAWSELQMARTESVDTKDFAAALGNPDSQRRFTVVSDEAELAAMLDAPLERWRVFLHPTQRRVVQMQANGPVRVLGGAGTGKTVAAMHRVRWLLENVLGPDDRILFTTFTKNLAIDIKENLAKLCSADQLRRVDVVNIHAWVDNFLRSNGREFNVYYPAASDPFWKRALAGKPLQPHLPDNFYRDEWEQVLQPEGIMDLASYLNVARTGRGTRLTARDRQAVWPVFEEYRRQLHAAGKRELIDAVRDARMLLLEGECEIMYRSIVVDEAQDMSAEVFRLLRTMLPPGGNDLFIVGDAHQRIYGTKVVLGRCGIEVRGRSRTLRVNYRTTEETCRWAVALLAGLEFDDLDEGTDDQRGYRSLLHGDPPTIRHFDSFGEEVEDIRSLLSDIEQQGMPLRRMCLVARTKKDRDRYSGALEAKDVPVLALEAETEDDREVEGLRVATMHRVKGLEFEHMIIAGMSARNMPASWLLSEAPDDAARERIEIMERSLLYVATTRARRQVYITAYGMPSKYLQQN